MRKTAREVRRRVPWLGRRGGDHSSCHTLSLKSYHLKIYSSCHTISPLSFLSHHLKRIPAVKRPSHIDQVRDGRAGALMSEEFADRDAPRERLRERLVSSWSSLWSSASFPTSSPALSPTLSCASNSGSHASGHGGPPSSSDGSCTRRHVVVARALAQPRARARARLLRTSAVHALLHGVPFWLPFPLLPSP